MMIITDDRTILLLLRRRRSKWYRMCCIGPKRHYRKDGSCRHSEELFARLIPDVRSRTKLDGWGGRNEPPYVAPVLDSAGLVIEIANAEP